MCVCGGDGEEVCLRLRGREEERGLSKEDESENQVCTWRRCKDASSWNKVTRVQGRQCSTLCTAAKKKRKGSFTGALPLGHPIDRDDNGPTTHHYPWPSSRHQMGRELSLSRRRKKGLSKSRELPREGRTRQSEGDTSSLHSLLPTLLCQNRLIQSVRKPWEMFFKRENQTYRRESCFLFKGATLCICLRQPLLRRGRGREAMGCDGRAALKRDKTNRSSAAHVISSLWC